MADRLYEIRGGASGKKSIGGIRVHRIVMKASVCYVAFCFIVFEVCIRRFARLCGTWPSLSLVGR